MKKKFYLFSLMLVFALFMSVPAKAQSNSNNNDGLLGGILGWLFGNNPPPGHPGSGGNQGTPAPINGNIVFLTIAGMAIGITAIKKKQSATAKV